jgi:hypothetical protein
MCHRCCLRALTRSSNKGRLAAIAHSRFWHEAAEAKRLNLRQLSEVLRKYEGQVPLGRLDANDPLLAIQNNSGLP